jgi:hypothetical protein
MYKYKVPDILPELTISLDEHLSTFQNIESQEMIKFHDEQKQILNDFHNYQNNILDKIQNIVYMCYLDAFLEKDDKIQNIYLYKIKIKKAELKFISLFQKEQNLALIKIQNAEIEAFNMVFQAITEALAIVMINQDYTSKQQLNVFNVWNQAHFMQNVLNTKEQARINVLNAWNQANDNIQNAMSKHLTTYINKVKYLNKTIKNLLGYQIKDTDKNLSKDFNLTEIQNYDILIKDNNNKSLDKIKNAMVLFLSKIENIKIQSMFKVNKAREEAMNDIQYKWNQYFASKNIYLKN